jgi:serine/threonine-protein kinase
MLARGMLTTRSAPGLVGQTLKRRFALTSFHRHGSAATIYHGTDLLSGAEVAVKVPATALAADAGVRSRLVREGRILKRLSHPNVVAALDADTVEGLAFVAMEFLRGDSLRTLLRERGHLPPHLAASIVRDVCRGLEHAHRAGVVHRDVRAVNVVADELDTPERSVKLVDFSLAKVQGDEDDTVDGANPTLLGTEVGDAACLSPELGRGEPTGPAHDVYGAGLLLFELLSGMPPFRARTALDLLRQHVEDPLPDLPGPQALASIVSRALEKRVSDRFSSAGAMADELETFLDERTPERVAADAELTELAPRPRRGLTLVMEPERPAAAPKTKEALTSTTVSASTRPPPQSSPRFGPPPASPRTSSPPVASAVESGDPIAATAPVSETNPHPSLVSLERALQALTLEQRESGARLERRVVILVCVVAAALLASVAALWSAVG